MKLLIPRFTALAALALVAGAQALTLTSPENGATVPLLSEKQKAFMRMTREERAPFFDDAQPQKEREIKSYRSEPRPVHLAWEGKGPFEVTVTKRCNGANVMVGVWFAIGERVIRDESLGIRKEFTRESRRKKIPAVPVTVRLSRELWVLLRGGPGGKRVSFHELVYDGLVDRLVLGTG